MKLDMTLKDWIMLIIPIACNGFILIAFQKKIERKYKKIEVIEIRKREIIETFLGKLRECQEVISEVDKEFKFRDDMADIIEKFKITISETVRYGKNNGFILKSDDKLETIRNKSGYCLTHLYEYQKLGITKEFDYPMDGQE